MRAVTRSRSLHAAVLLGLLVSCFACGRRWEDAELSERSAAMVVLAGAEEVRLRTTGDGRETVAYRLAQPYPAAEAITTIAAELEAAGWQPLRELATSPGLRSAYLAGWADLTETSAERPENVLVWMADWVNDAGEWLEYRLQYRSPPGAPPDRTNVEVVALRLPEAAARGVLEQAAAARGLRSLDDLLAPVGSKPVIE